MGSGTLRVPQGSVLGPTLFLIYINDIDNAVDVAGSVLKKFAVDTKWALVVESEEERKIFQRGLDNLVQWSIEWQMLFNVDKCHIIHMGRKNQLFDYSMGGRPLEVVEFEKDVGVIIDNTLKPSLQRVKAAKKGQMVLGQLARVVSYRDKVTFFNLKDTTIWKWKDQVILKTSEALQKLGFFGSPDNRNSVNYVIP